MSEVPAKKPAVKRHLTASQKAEAIALWRAGEVTLDDLAKKFKKDRTTFVRLFDAAGVKKGEAKEETEKRVQEAVERAIVDDATVLANRVKETREDHYKYATGLAKLTWSIVVKTTQEGRAIGTAAADMKALQLASQVMKTVREERYAILNINNDADDEDRPLPDLVVQELTAEDIREMHRQQIMTVDELGIEDKELGDESLIDDVVEDDGDDEVVEEE